MTCIRMKAISLILIENAMRRSWLVKLGRCLHGKQNYGKANREG
jgi:hypothetical protein